MMHDMDSYDLRLLDLLQKDGRLSNQELAESVHLSPSQCSRRRMALDPRVSRSRKPARVGYEESSSSRHHVLPISMGSKREESMRRLLINASSVLASR